MHNPSPAGIVVHDVTHAYESQPVVRDVSLEVAAGQSVSLLGPSGCGKTTLLRLIAGLERPSTGTITIDGTPAVAPGVWVPPEKRRIGMVFQDWALFPHLSVSANVGYGLPRSARLGPAVERALDLVGLNAVADRMPDTLSGGQQQRVALARALAPQPNILLLDEPFSNLDATLRVEVRSEVHRILHELGITALFVTHDQEEAFVLGDQVAVMRDGRVVQVDTPHGLYTKPAAREIAEFIGAGAIIRTHAADGVAQSPIGPLPVSAVDGPVDVLLRPEQLHLTSNGDSGTGNGEVDLVEYYGHDTMVLVRTADNAILTVRCAPDITVRRGDRVTVGFTSTEAISFPV